LPVVSATPEWKDPAWKDPTNEVDITWDALPIAETARQLRNQFGKDFDIVIPDSYQFTNNSGTVDIGRYMVKLQLKNVTASEVFGAMNLEFEAENTPVRWELKLNGSRSTAILRFMPEQVPPPPVSKRMVFFVGDLIGDESSGGMTMPQIVQTVSDVWAKAYGQAGVIQFYDPAQLVIVTGTEDQIDFINQTMGALRKKIEMARLKAHLLPPKEWPRQQMN
jgi:hypothetical protein